MTWTKSESSAAAIVPSPVDVGSSPIWNADLAELLAAGVSDVVRAWSEDEGFQLSRAAAQPVVAAIAEAVRGEVTAAAVPGAPMAWPPWVGALRVVHRLRAEWVRRAASSDPALHPTRIFAVLDAFDRVERRIDADCAQRFVGRLSGADSARLVVELAHDMRSAMGSILFLSETLRTGGSGVVNAVQQRQLGLIYSAALGLNAIVNDVMDLARGTARLLEQQPVPFQLGEVVASVLTIVRPTAEEKGIAVVTTLPDIGTRVGHPTVLGRILLNLVTNALKFTEVGSVHLEVSREDGVGLRFSVRDTGRGMSPAVLRTLFDAFRARGQTGDEYFSGAGLGLAMCQSLLTQLGSTLDVDSAEGRGTTFAFSLSLPFPTLL